MHKTPFAGLTAPDPNDPPLTVDGGSFATRNPEITDYFLRIGAVSHRHDEHPALADPIIAASAIVDTTGGTIPAGRDIYVGYTLIDTYGGETRISPVVNASTPPPLDAPVTPFDAAFDDTAGTLPVGSYQYALTLLDESGGETMLGPSSRVERPPGSVTGQVNFTGLDADLGPDMGALWRLWRADNGGQYNIIAAGSAAIFTDNGIDPVDHAATPPTTSRGTRSTNVLNISIPSAAGEPGMADGQASAVALYLSDDGTFSNPCLYDIYPRASAGRDITITDLAVIAGAPPDVSRSIPGAHKITAGELADGAGGGGLFSYPQDYTADLTNTSQIYTDLTDVVLLSRDDNTATALRRGHAADSFGEVRFSADHLGPEDSSFNPDTYRVIHYAAGAPGMKDGSVTVRGRFSVIDADIGPEAISVYIGQPDGPALRAELSASTGGWGLEVAIGDLYEGLGTIVSDGGVDVPGIATDHWLRLTRNGMNVTAEWFTTDPDTVGAAPLHSVTFDLSTSPYARRWEWAFNQQALPGFGWMVGDSLGRPDTVQIWGMKAHAASGGEGYPNADTRLVLQDHNSDVTPRRTLNFAGGLEVSDDRSLDRLTVRLGYDNVLFDRFNFEGGYAGYATKRNMADWHATGSAGANAAGSDGRVLIAYPAAQDRQKAELRLAVIGADDLAGLMLEATSLDDFLIGQVNNASGAPALEIAYASGGALTPLASAGCPAASAGMVLAFEISGDRSGENMVLGAALYPVDTTLDFAAPIAQVSVRVHYDDPVYVAFHGALTGAPGFRVVPAAGGGNTLRVTEWVVSTA